MDMAERFWAKVDASGGPMSCWLWRGARRAAYGLFWADGRTRPAHVVSWELANGRRFPPGMDGCHSCDNPPCVNPAHVFPGTIADNARDAVAKGRIRLPGAGAPLVAGFCGRGHELTPENTVVEKNGRRCRTCKRASAHPKPLALRATHGEPQEGER